MTQSIWKFETPFSYIFTLKMPIGSEILSVQQDQKTFKPCIWALVCPEKETEERFFELFGTGYEFENEIGVNRKYLGTYQYQKGEFVGHLFERI